MQIALSSSTLCAIDEVADVMEDRRDWCTARMPAPMPTPLKTSIRSVSTPAVMPTANTAYVTCTLLRMILLAMHRPLEVLGRDVLVLADAVAVRVLERRDRSSAGDEPARELGCRTSAPKVIAIGANRKSAPAKMYARRAPHLPRHGHRHEAPDVAHGERALAIEKVVAGAEQPAHVEDLLLDPRCPRRCAGARDR